MTGILPSSFIVGSSSEEDTSLTDTTNTQNAVPQKKRSHPLSSDITDQHALLHSIQKQYDMATTLPYILKSGDDGFGSRMELIDSGVPTKEELTLDLTEMTLDFGDLFSATTAYTIDQDSSTDIYTLCNDSGNNNNSNGGTPSLQHNETIRSPTLPPPIHADQQQEHQLYVNLPIVARSNSISRQSSESTTGRRNSDSQEFSLHDDENQKEQQQEQQSPPPPLPQHLSPLPTAPPPTPPQHSPSTQHSSPPSPAPPSLPLDLLPLPPLPDQSQQKPLPPSVPHHQHEQVTPPLPEKHHDHHTMQLPSLPMSPQPVNEANRSPCPTGTQLTYSANSSSSSLTTIGTSGTILVEPAEKEMIDHLEYEKQQQYSHVKEPMPSSTPPLPSTPSLDMKFNMTANQPIHSNIDGDYFPDSSLYAASITKPAPNPLSLKPHHPNFPPATLESLNNFRKETQAMPNEPALQLNFAKYLMEAVEQLQIDDKTRSTKAKTAMMMEAQRIVKKLAMKSKIGQSGFADAQFYLANAYGAGLMLFQVSHEKAFALYLQGSKQCHPGCAYRVGVCYELGLGTRKNHARAIRFYRKAAKLSDPSAMYKLAMVLLHGLLGQGRHPKEAISWLKRAAPLADAYHPEILYELGSIYEKEDIPSVIPDQEYAYELLTKAARFGYAPAQYKLGVAYENGIWEYPVDPRRSIAWYSKAVEQGHLESALGISGWYLTGAVGSDGESILPQDDLEAYLWARKAADAGFAKGQYACGYYTESGIGVDQNLDEARMWYKQAAEQQYGRAIQRLIELKDGESYNNGNKNNNKHRQQKKQQRYLSLQPPQLYLDDTEIGDGWKSANYQDQRRHTWEPHDSSIQDHNRSSCQIM